MPEIEFVGDWDIEAATAIAQQIKATLDLSMAKSLGVGDGGGAEVSVQQLEDNPIQELLSKRQKRLIEMLRQAGAKTFEGAGLEKSADLSEEDGHICGPSCTHSWDDYNLGGGSLQKAVGSLKRDAQGRTYKMNRNQRWERFNPSGFSSGGTPEFDFLPTDGAFGRGVYFPVLQAPQGYLRLRVRADISGAELIDDGEFHQLEADFAQDINRLLDAKGVRAIAQADGAAVTVLCVRSPEDLQVLGAVADSGALPQGPGYDYRLVSLIPAEDHLVIEVEVSPAGAAIAPQGQELIKAAKIFSGSTLSGTVLTPVSSAPIDRALLRRAVERCKLDGVPVGDVAIELVEGVPDYLPGGTYAYCLPSQGTIYIAPHDPEKAVAQHLKILTRELRAAARAGALPNDVALETILAAQDVDGEWWLEHHIKRFTGAILASRVHDITTTEDVGPWARYVGLLAARGLAHWGSRRAIAECIAEDYRCAHDPAGFPNEVTMLWDLAVPSVARMAQQELLMVLTGAPLEKAGRSPAPGQMSLFGGGEHHEGETRTNAAGHQEVLQGGRWHLKDGQQAPLAALPVVAAAPSPAPASEPSPVPHDKESWDEPLTGVTPAAVLRTDSDDAKRFEKFLKESSDPEILLELIMPANWSTANLKTELATAKKAIATFMELGISESDAVYDLTGRLGDAFEGKSPPPEDQFMKPVYDLISSMAEGFNEADFSVNPRQLAWEYAREYDGRSGLRSFRAELESDMADAQDPADRREYELSIALVDRVSENLPAINKAIQKLIRAEDVIAEKLGDFETVDDALERKQLFEAALHPTARAIGKTLEADTEAADNAFEHYSAIAAEQSKELSKAGKPCGRGWISELKQCSPEKRSHALKNRRGDLERYANTKRQAKGLRPKPKPDDISLDELEASDKMLNESLARVGKLKESLDKFADTIQAALDAPPSTFESALNNIVPFDPEQEKIVGKLKADLLDLHKLAFDFAQEQVKRAPADWDSIAAEIGRKAMQDKRVRDRVDALNRAYKGKITQSEANLAALFTRTFHNLHPRRKIQMPKGMTQREYYDVVNKLLDGDKAAIKKYTVARRKKK
jgi:hypothetical protein